MSKIKHHIVNLSSLITIALVCTFNWNLYAQSLYFKIDQQCDVTNDSIIHSFNNPWIYNQLKANYNAVSEDFYYSSYSEDLIDELSPLQINNLRFPGGTIANFYHFFGEKGYGIDLNELECREGLLDIPQDIIKRTLHDQFMDTNIIVHHVEQVKKLENVQGNKVSTNYVLNIFTHYVNGDFFNINNKIDEAISETFTFNGLGSVLNQKFNTISETAIPDAIPLIYQILGSEKIDEAKASLKADLNFQTRVTENIGALLYLTLNGLKLNAIELGNELYFYLMFFDDDLSEIGFDCTNINPNNQIKLADLSIGGIIQSLVKYLLLYDIYDETIKKFVGDYPLGLVMGPHGSVIEFEGPTVFNIKREWNSYNKIMHLWNLSMALHPKAKGLIQHHYMNKIWGCGLVAFDNLESALPTYPTYYNFYFDHLEDIIYESIPDTIEKDIWMTEWNMEGATGSNTIVQTGYIAQFIDFILSHECNNKSSKISTINYHNLVIDIFWAFALINASYELKDGILIRKLKKNLMYFPFLIFSNIFKRNNTLTNVAIENNHILPMDIPDYLVKMDAYFSKDSNTLEFIYTNYSEDTLSISLDSIKVDVDPSFKASINTHQFLSAERWYSSNQGCVHIYDSTNQKYFDYKFNKNIILDQEKLILPPLSHGNYQLKFEDEAATPIRQNHANRVHLFNLFPNPNDGSFTVSNRTVELMTLQITNILGEEIHHQELYTGSNFIHIEFAPPGSYFAKIVNKTNGNIESVLKFTITNK